MINKQPTSFLRWVFSHHDGTVSGYFGIDRTIQFSSGIVERAKCERAWKSPHAILDPNAYGFGNARVISLLYMRRGALGRDWRKAFLACGNFHARSCFARSAIPEEKWGLLIVMVGKWWSRSRKWWARLELTEPLSVHICLCRREHELYWTHNFFILDKGCPILTWRWCFLQSRQTVRYPQKSGSHLALISRCSSILAIGGLYHTVEKVSRVHSTGKSLDRLSTTIWAGVG